MYPNLKAEMARKAITQKELAEFLGKSTVTVGNWMGGNSGGFPIEAALRMKHELFPECSVDYLFEHKAV